MSPPIGILGVVGDETIARDGTGEPVNPVADGPEHRPTADGAAPRIPAPRSPAPEISVSETLTMPPSSILETPARRSASEALTSKIPRAAAMASSVVGHPVVSGLRRSVGSVRGLTKRPAYPLVLTGVLLLALLGVAGAAGGLLMPRAAPPRAAALTPYPADEDAAGGAGSASPETSEPGEGPEGSLGPLPSGSSQPGVEGPGIRGLDRPADALAGWALPIASRLGVPAVALQAYGYAELVLSRTAPACKLSWTTLAGIAKIESNHGRAAGATLSSDGRALPAIIGLPLDGQGGRDRIADTDSGRLDGDRTFDRAVGPMQFIPATWEQYSVDADNDGAKDPNDVDDAALAAGTYLCSSGRDLSTAPGWYAAAMTYNAVKAYVTEVYNAANDYGIRSRG